MKKQKLGLNKLSLTKSRVAELNKSNVVGGGESTNPQCIFTGYLDGCDVTANTCTGGGGGTNNCGTNDPTCNTQAILSCLFAC
ncbi:hypothetical protein H2O64_23260 [Kordia sp. YSTF-M3]|uniref:Natural product n=1 Tax=Kordia aestuariivivens TaxID=2759037 RepID=A0ABR7QGA6_9FLAO|nr:hypothetical protein [Kordia aestuariivivens]MBC8757606.1 hypothetical protein [Kordia aestuariivivens]